MVVLLTADSLFTYVESTSSTISVGASYALSFSTMTLCSFFAFNEAKQLLFAMRSPDKSERRNYIFDFWNALDFVAVSLITAGYTFRYSGYESLEVPVFAAALPPNYLNMLFFMQGFRESGQLIRMILGILTGIKYFVIILFVSMIGFSFAFYILYRTGSGVFVSPGPGKEVVVDSPMGMESVPMR